MATTPEFDAQKIPDRELASFAEQGSAEATSVIVEITGEPPQVELAESLHGAPSQPAEVIGFDPEAERQKMDRLQRQLTELGATELVRLDAAQAFVVDLTPGQLRAVSLLSETGCIRPNRTHYTK